MSDMKTKLHDLSIFNGTVLDTDLSDSKSIYDYIRINLAEVRVGPGGDYLTIGSAIANGEQAIVLIGNTTETGNIIINKSISIRGLDIRYTIDMGAYQFQIDTSTENNLLFNFLTIRYSDGSPISTSASGFYSHIYINNIIIRNESTGGGYEFLDGNTKTIIIFKDIKYYLPNYATSGISSPRAYCNIYGDGFTLIGGGSSSGTYSILLPKLSYINNLHVEGYFYQSNNSDTLHIVLDTVNFLVCKAVGVHIRCVKLASNIYMTGANSQFNISTGHEISLSNFSINGMVQLKGMLNYSSISDGECEKLGIGGNSIYRINITNVKFNFTTTETNNYGDNLCFTNCFFNESYIIQGNNLIFDKCIFGDTSGGTKTLTINGTSDGAKLILNKTEAAIIDNGTNTQTLMNDLF